MMSVGHFRWHKIRTRSYSDNRQVENCFAKTPLAVVASHVFNTIAWFSLHPSKPMTPVVGFATLELVGCIDVAFLATKTITEPFYQFQDRHQATFGEQGLFPGYPI